MNFEYMISINRGACINRRSLWSAVAWGRFGSQFRVCGNDRSGSPLGSLVPEICRIREDYQSGSKQPHSKGYRHFLEKP